MKILFLYGNPIALNLAHWLQKNNEIVITKKPITEQLIKSEKFDLIISYSYRTLIPKKILELLECDIINLHISYLPWNRGADPNIWSWLDNTPKGVTIHFINEGIDTGDIIVQKQVLLNENMTLRESYDILNQEIIKLFMDSFENINKWKSISTKQKEKGSYHSKGELMKIMANKTINYDMKIKDFCKMVKKNESSF